MVGPNYGIALDSSSDCTITNNTISENRIGLFVVYYSQNNKAHYNNIFDNTEYGINATRNNGHPINAINNFWGATSGPYHPTENPKGEGDNITEYVEFDPWLVKEVNSQPVAHIDSISPNPAVKGEHIRFVGHGTDDGSIEQYGWRSSIDGEFYDGSDLELKYDDLSNGTHTIFYKVLDNWGVWSDEVSDTLTVNGKPRAHNNFLSPNPAIDGDPITFTGQGTDDGTIQLYSWRSDNIEIYNGTNSSFTLTDLSAGYHIIYFKVQDNYGTWSEEVSMNITILKDTDGDGIPDKDDDFINDIAASKDEDGDGYPNEWNVGKTAEDSTTGLKLDEFPDDPEKWKKDDSSGGGLLPGFEAMAVVGVIALVNGFSLIKMKRRK